MAPALGVVAIDLAFLLNEWSVPWLLGHHAPGLEARSALALHTLRGCVAALGLALLARPLWPRLPSWLDGRALLALAPFLLLDAAFWTLGCARDDVPLASVLAPLALVNKLAVDSLVLLAVGLAAGRVFQGLRRARAAVVAVTLLWGAAVIAEILVYWFGHTRLERAHLTLVSRASIDAYLGAGLLAFTLLGLGLSLASGLLLARATRRARWVPVGGLALAAFALGAADLPTRYRDLTHPLRTRLAAADADAQLARLDYLERGSALRLVGELLHPPRRARRIEDLGPYSDVVERYRLGLGQPTAPPLESRSYRRVVLLLFESLSSCFSGLHNPELPSTLTPFLDSRPVQRGAFRNHRTTAQPTLPGMVVTLLSHPNPDLALNGVERPRSLVEVLARAGWRSVLLRSDSRHFGNSGLVLGRLGLEEQLDREHFERDPEAARAVSGWGACDRIVLEEAADLLEARRDERVFLTVLTCDTHSPRGRRDYGDLEYPEAPQWIHSHPDLAPLLRAIFRADHDLRLFAADLERRGLFGDDTLVIVTSDHSCPVTVGLAGLPGAHRTPFGRIPLVLLTPRELPPHRLDRDSTQLDVAPTLLHLLGLEAPRGMWGRSLFDGDPRGPVFVGSSRGKLEVGEGVERRTVSIDAPRGGDAALLAELFLGWVPERIGPPPAPAGLAQRGSSRR